MSDDINVEIIQKTQKSLGKYVKKPPLTEKLLKKPPFRFLHDVVVTVVKETGFLKGLYSERELNSENVKDKEGKVAFLTKLIDAVKTLSHNTELAVRPSKIVAGLEPTETNVLLQTLAKCIDKKIDSTDYVKKLKSQTNHATTERKKSKKAASIDKPELVKKASRTSLKDEKIKTSSSRNTLEKKRNLIETPLSTDRTKSKSSTSTTNNKETKHKKDASKTKKSSRKKDSSREPPINEVQSQQIEENAAEVLNNDESVENNNTNETSKEIEVKAEEKINDEVKKPEFEERKASARPKSARPKSGDNKKEKMNILAAEERILSSKPKPSTEEVKIVTAPPIQRPKSSLRPPSVRPSSARPGAPRLRPDSAIPMQEVVALGKINVIVENFDKDADEEETVVIQNAPDVIESQVDILDVPSENKGQLVEQILEQINEVDLEKLRPNVNIEWEKDGLRGKDATTKEITQLRSLIQSLTRVANPLGKLMNYLHEDIDAMHTELEMWTNTKKQLFLEIAKQKRISEDANKPLLGNLNHLEQEIKKEEQEILSVRSSILKNEIRIKELLTK